MVISANELKIKGVSTIEMMLEKLDEVLISVQGKNRFVVLVPQLQLWNAYWSKKNILEYYLNCYFSESKLNTTEYNNSNYHNVGYYN